MYEGARPIVPPMAPLMIAAMTPEGYEVEVWDENARGPYPLGERRPDLIGVSGLTPSAYRMNALADEARQVGAVSVVGGMHVSALYSDGEIDEVLRHFDSVVVGACTPGLWGKVLGDAFNGGLRRLYRASHVPALLGHPTPRYDLLDPRHYILPASLQTSQGCPYDCEFCSIHIICGRRMRFRPESLLHQDLAALPPGMVTIIDDAFGVNREQAERAAGLLREYGRSWVCEATARDLARGLGTPDDLLPRLARLGCFGVFVGFESLSQRYRKSLPVRLYEKLVRRMHSLGMKVLGAFVFGADDEEDRSVFERTVEFVKRLRLEFAQYSLAIPLPGTRLRRRLKQEGRIIDQNYEHYDGSMPLIRHPRITPEQQLEGLTDAYRWTYSTSSTLWRFLARWPNRGNLTSVRHLPLLIGLNRHFRKVVEGWAKVVTVDYWRRTRRPPNPKAEESV
mgnify:CR=1 FL=1